MKIINNPENPEGIIWVLGQDRHEPESMIKKYSEELAKLYQMHLNEQIGFRGTITGKPVFSAKLGKLYAENWAAAIGNDAQNPEEFAVELTIKGVDKTGKAYNNTVIVTKKDLGFAARIAVKEIPLHLDKDNYHHSMFPYWGMVREQPSIGDVTPGLGTMLFGGGRVWYSKLNHIWVLASGKELAEKMAAFSIPNLDKVLLNPSQYSEEVASYDKAIAINSNATIVKQNREIALKKRTEASIIPKEDRHDLVAETGSDPEKWIERGLLLIDDGNYNEAIEYFQKALTLNRSHPKVNEYIKKARQLRDSK